MAMGNVGSAVHGHTSESLVVGKNDVSQGQAVSAVRDGRLNDIFKFGTQSAAQMYQSTHAEQQSVHPQHMHHWRQQIKVK